MADLDAVVRLMTGLFREDAGQRDATMDQEWPIREGAAYVDGLIADEGSCLMVADHEGMVIGYAVGLVAAPGGMQLVAVAHLESLFVEPAARGLGVGRQLADAVITWARGRGAKQVRVTAYATNDGAVRLYRRLGFTPFEQTVAMPLDGDS